MSEAQQAAVFYATDSGFSVIPVDAVSKKPLLEWKEFQTRKASVEEIESWWKKWPEAGVGIVTGAISGITVVDSAAGAVLNLFGLKDCATPTVVSGGGGKHFYFAYTPKVKNS